ncbi:MAG: OmpH family outer membrane protein [Parachlamydiaceae bacterium]|nr:OmpH family outer membrane protein [Parachlamydiaceae bacterium]
MKRLISLGLAASMMISVALFAAQYDDSLQSSGALKVGVVNFKLVVEESKFGKLEQGNFETLKKQIEGVVEEKDKARAELAAKFNDPDYVDSLSPEAENELKHKFRLINQELGQMEGQFYQTLNQANVKILQKLNEMASTASVTVAKENQLNLILNDDGCFFYDKTLDVSRKIIANLDALYETEMKTNKAPGALN